MTPWDQRAARFLVRPLAATPVTPNQLTALTLALALAGAALLASGEPDLVDWGAGLFVLSRFMDHFDGELARLTGRSSRFGYYFDGVAGALSYAALFLGAGVGLRDGALGDWALALGVAGAAAALVNLPLSLATDALAAAEKTADYPAFAGFELEDGIYLIAPLTWLGFLPHFFAVAGVGACAYLVWTAAGFLRARSARR